ESEITAENITINPEIKNNTMKIITGVTENSGEGDGNRALAIAQLRNIIMSIQDIKDDTTRKEFLGEVFKENEEHGYD
ncbi:flagellar hook-associated protein FlgK, partial [Clostridium tepidum]